MLFSVNYLFALKDTRSIMLRNFFCTFHCWTMRWRTVLMCKAVVSCHTDLTQDSALSLFRHTILYEQLSSKWWLLEVCLNHIWVLKFDKVWSKPRKKVHRSLGFTTSYWTQLKCCHITSHKKSRKFTSYAVSETEQFHLFPECVLSCPAWIQRKIQKLQETVTLWLAYGKPGG